MNANGNIKKKWFKEWKSEDHFNLIKSFVGSVIEFIEKGGHHQRVVGTLEKCDKNTFNLTDASINGDFFGDYVLNDWEVSKWRLREYLPKERPKRDLQPNSKNNRSEDNNKYVIPNGNEDEEEYSLEGQDQMLNRYIDHYGDHEVIDLNEDENQLQVNVKPLSQKASNDIIFIDEINEVFEEVIQKLKKSNSVGFAVFGEEISREGDIDLMAFATPDAIYAFDCNNTEIVTQLKPLLESKELQKVMFALRLPSDALYHLFGIDLSNAVDIRIWDFCLQKKKFISSQISAKPELRPLETLLRFYLNIRAPKTNPNIDFKRFSTKVENYIRVNTLFLRELFSIINRKLLEDVYQMNSRCLTSLRSAQGLEYIAVKDDEMELQIIDNPNVEYEEIERQIISLSSNKPINGFRGKEIQIQSNDEVIIDSDEELDEIVVRLPHK